MTIRFTSTAPRLRVLVGQVPAAPIRARGPALAGMLTPTSEVSFYATFRSSGFEMLGWTFTSEIDASGQATARGVQPPMKDRKLTTVHADAM